jgi:hypothetical protein
VVRSVLVEPHEVAQVLGVHGGPAYPARSRVAARDRR